MTITYMDVTSTHATKPVDFLAKAGRIALAMIALAFAAGLAVTIRVFVFEYFHGDQHPLQVLVRLVASLINL